MARIEFGPLVVQERESASVRAGGACDTFPPRKYNVYLRQGPKVSSPRKQPPTERTPDRLMAMRRLNTS